jgi:hypothetical protein
LERDSCRRHGRHISTLTAIPSLAAQALSIRSVDVTVTEPHGRTVSGLQKEDFAITEAGAARAITGFTEFRDERPTALAHYRLEFESSDPGAKVEVVVKPRAGLPHLTIAWK